MPFIFILIEFLLIYSLISNFGFLYTLFFYIATTMVGVLVVKGMGFEFFRGLRGLGPTAAVSILSKGLLFLSGLFLIIPSLMSKAVGLFLLFPPFRYLFALIFSGWLLKKVFSEQSRLYQFGGNGFGFQFNRAENPFNANPRYNPDPRNPFTQSTGDVIDAEYRTVEDDPKLLK